MKCFFFLLLITMALCDLEGSDGEGNLENAGDGLSSPRDVFNPYDQSPPPAVASAAEAGVELDQGLTPENPFQDADQQSNDS